MKYLIILLLAVTPLVRAETAVATPVAPPVPVASSPQIYPLVQLLNLFVTHFSYEHVEWQRDIRLEGSRDKAVQVVSQQPGRQLGESGYFGAYTYTPKHYSELTKGQQKDVLDSPQLLAWLTWFGGPNRVVSYVPKLEAAPAEAPLAVNNLRPNYGKFSYTVTPNEMLSDQAVQLKLHQ